MVDGAAILDFIKDKLVFLVEIQNSELLARFVLECNADIGQQSAP
jgi:hypothetical protein